MAEKWVDQALYEKKRRNRSTIPPRRPKPWLVKKLKETLLKLSKSDKARKIAKAAIESSERQAQEQLLTEKGRGLDLPCLGSDH